MLSKDNPQPPLGSVEANVAAQEVQVLEAATATKDRVAEDVEEKGEDAIKGKKAPQAGLANYFVSITTRVVIAVAN